MACLCLGVAHPMLGLLRLLLLLAQHRLSSLYSRAQLLAVPRDCMDNMRILHVTWPRMRAARCDSRTLPIVRPLSPLTLMLRAQEAAFTPHLAAQSPVPQAVLDAIGQDGRLCHRRTGPRPQPAAGAEDALAAADSTLAAPDTQLQAESSTVTEQQVAAALREVRLSLGTPWEEARALAQFLQEVSAKPGNGSGLYSMLSCLSLCAFVTLMQTGNQELPAPLLASSSLRLPALSG